MTFTYRSFMAAFALAGALIVGSVAAATQTSSDPQNREAQIEHKFEKAERYYAECAAVEEGDFDAIKPYLRAFTDMEVMAQTMADPVEFAKLMQITSDPRTMHVMMKCSTEPVMWDTWMRGLTDWQKMSRTMTYFMNPGMYMAWITAPMNPQMYAPMFQMMNPAYYTRWTNAMMNPAFYQPMFAFADPNWYTPRLQWMMDPRSYQPIAGASDTAVVSPPATAQPSATE
ncbi:MAG: hypothetical protein OET44_20640 [Gammaproteobacteria bacterium]|nr:hypothetical protein [Gammaproteobacteria bacterium]